MVLYRVISTSKLIIKKFQNTKIFSFRVIIYISVELRRKGTLGQTSKCMHVGRRGRDKGGEVGMEAERQGGRGREEERGGGREKGKGAYQLIDLRESGFGYSQPLCCDSVQSSVIQYNLYVQKDQWKMPCDYHMTNVRFTHHTVCM